MHFRLPIVLFCALLSGLTRPAAADTEIPYEVLYQALAPGLQFERYAHLSVRQQVRSKDLSVAPSQIQIDVLSKSGTLRVPISAAGEMQFPMNESLRTENPMVRSNQPKGSLSLSVTMAIKTPANLKMPYADLFKAAEQATIALQAINPKANNIQVPRIDFFFEPTVEAKIDLISDRSEQTLLANAKGVISIRIDPLLVQQKTELIFSKPVLVALPHVSQ
jgi:hypothetical protein